MSEYKEKLIELEGELQHGLEDVDFKYQNTDYVYSARTPDFDWHIGYDVEEQIASKTNDPGFIIYPKNQEHTLSCGGQAIAKYASSRYALFDESNPSYIEFSARDAYSHNVLPSGGVYAWSIILWAKNNGILPEEKLPSIPMTEDNMRDKGLEEDGYTESFKMLRQLVKAGIIQIVSNNIDAVAKAIRDNGGVVFALRGNNNGSWFSTRPNPPESYFKSDWGHLMYAGKAKINNAKKEIGGLQSWGDVVGDRGWQWFGENWFGTSFIRAIFTWSPEVEKIANIELYKEIDAYRKSNNLKWWKTATWDAIKTKFNTDMSRGNFYDWLQLKKLIKQVNN